MHRFFSSLILTLALATGPAQAESIELNRGQMLAFAMQTLEQNEPAKALALVEAVLKVYPDSVQALILKSQALRDLGRYDAAREAAQAAWALAETDAGRYGAATSMAQALSSAGRRTTAQFWLRRASDYASTEAQRSYAAKGYRYVKSQNPVSYSFSFGVAPNSNINNGSRASVIWLGNLPFTPTVYTGYTAEASAGVSYRFSGAGDAQTTVGLQGFARVNWLDQESRTLMDSVGGADATPQDFDFVVLAATLRHLRPLAENVVLDVKAGAGLSFYGWEHYANFFNLGAEVRSPLAGGADELAVFADARMQLPADPTDSTVYSFELGARLRHVFDGGDALTLTLAGDGAVSATASREYLGLRGAVEWDVAEPVLGADLTLGVSAAYRDYPVSGFTTTGRQDWLLGGTIEAAFPDAAYMGFVPVVNADYDRNYSNVAAFRSEALRVGLGLRSQF